MSKELWHYPRREFAKTVYELLISGPAHALRLFGPRRTGKTEFLLRDLGTLAERKGHRVVYASLWQHLGSPTGVMLYEMDRALHGGTIIARIKRAASSISVKYELKVPGMGKLAIDLGDKGPPGANHLLALERYCEKLSSGKKPTFLLLDEVQEIAKSKGAKELIASLRTSLDKRKDGLVSVFTGSSQSGLRKMFSARDAPFYRFADSITLPELDQEFVEHQLAAFHKAATRTLGMRTALSTFDRCEKNPLFFRKWLSLLALNPTLAPRTAFSQLQEEIAEELEFPTLWLDLSHIQRAVARVIAESIPQVYGEDSRNRLRELTGKKPPGASKLQTAVKRLSRQETIENSNGKWRISDPLLSAWIQARPESEF